MSSGITFTSRDEMLEYASRKRAEGYKVKIVPLGKETYKVMLTKLKRSVLQPGKSFHITRRDLGASPVLRAQESDSMIDIASFRGVSFSPSIDQCLDSIPDAPSGHDKAATIFYVYTPKESSKALVPETEDMEYSEELRIPSDIKGQLVGKIRARVLRNRETGEWENKWEWI